MARASFRATVGTAQVDGSGNPTGQIGGQNNAKIGGGNVDTTAVAADVATLVADGATPTQAHVTTLAADWATLLGGYTGDVVISYDTTKLTTITQLKRVFDMILSVAYGSGNLTA